MLRLLQDVINGPPVKDLPERRDLTLAGRARRGAASGSTGGAGCYPRAVTYTAANFSTNGVCRDTVGRLASFDRLRMTRYGSG